MAMKALSSKPFVGQEAKLRTRGAGVVAARLPVVVRAQAEEPVSCCTYWGARGKQAEFPSDFRARTACLSEWAFR
jgi:hypothetical protein